MSVGIRWLPTCRRLGDNSFFYFVSRETVSPEATLHARMIFYNGEDPATGSAAGCCTAWAVRNGVLASGQQGLIEQGMETRRPSSIYIRAEKHGDADHQCARRRTRGADH